MLGKRVSRAWYTDNDAFVLKPSVRNMVQRSTTEMPVRNAQSRRDGRTYQTWGDLHRNVSPLLGLGILIAPLIFGWTLLDKRYSTRARVLGPWVDRLLGDRGSAKRR